MGSKIDFTALVFFLVLSCGTETKEKVFFVQDEPTKYFPAVDGDPRSSNSIDSFFDTYIEEFQSLDPDQAEVTTPMSFADIEEDDVLGVCITWTSPTLVLKEIQIDRTSFFNALAVDPFIPRTIIFHELGHCELDLDHDSTLAKAEKKIIPYTIMFPKLFSDPSVYKKHDDHYMDVLFGGEGTLEPIRFQDNFTDKVFIGEKNGFVGHKIFFTSL